MRIFCCRRRRKIEKKQDSPVSHPRVPASFALASFSITHLVSDLVLAYHSPVTVFKLFHFPHWLLNITFYAVPENVGSFQTITSNILRVQDVHTAEVHFYHADFLSKSVQRDHKIDSLFLTQSHSFVISSEMFVKTLPPRYSEHSIHNFTLKNTPSRMYLHCCESFQGTGFVFLSEEKITSAGSVLYLGITRNNRFLIFFSFRVCCMFLDPQESGFWTLFYGGKNETYYLTWTFLVFKRSKKEGKEKCKAKKGRQESDEGKDVGKYKRNKENEKTEKNEKNIVDGTSKKRSDSGGENRLQDVTLGETVVVWSKNNVSSFGEHHVVKTTDGHFLFIQDRESKMCDLLFLSHSS